MGYSSSTTFKVTLNHSGDLVLEDRKQGVSRLNSTHELPSFEFIQWDKDVTKGRTKISGAMKGFMS